MDPTTPEQYKDRVDKTSPFVVSATITPWCHGNDGVHDDKMVLFGYYDLATGEWTEYEDGEDPSIPSVIGTEGLGLYFRCKYCNTEVKIYYEPPGRKEIMEQLHDVLVITSHPERSTK